MGALILLALALIVAAVTIIILAGSQNGDSHEASVARMQAKQKETLHQIDTTGAYYAGLYRYIARRLDDESRRRQSG